MFTAHGVSFLRGMSKADACLFTETCCRVIKSELGTRFPLIFALKHSASGSCNCQCWSLWEPFPVAAPGAKDTDTVLPSSGAPVHLPEPVII